MLVLSPGPVKILFPTLGVTSKSPVFPSVVRVRLTLPIGSRRSRRDCFGINEACLRAQTGESPPTRRLHTAGLAIHWPKRQWKQALQGSRSQPGRGSEQYAKLDEEFASENKKAPESSREIRTLLVEDDANESALLAEFLRLYGIKVETANDGQAALDYLQSHERPDVILLDMRMPRCDGPATLAAIRSNAQFQATKVFAVSGADPKECTFQGSARGVDGWFRKPVNPRKLVEEMNVALGRN